MQSKFDMSFVGLLLLAASVSGTLAADVDVQTDVQKDRRTPPKFPKAYHVRRCNEHVIIAYF